MFLHIDNRCKQNFIDKRVSANTTSYPDVEKRKTFIGTDKVQIQQPSLTKKKSVNPNISTLIDSIVDGGPAPKKSNKLFPVKKTSPRVDGDDDDDITDTDNDDDDIDDLPPLKTIYHLLRNR